MKLARRRSRFPAVARQAWRGAVDFATLLFVVLLVVLACRGWLEVAIGIVGPLVR